MIGRTKLSVHLRLGADRVLWIDPQKVRFHVGTNQPALQEFKDRINRFGRRVPSLRTPAVLFGRALGQSESWVIARRHYRTPEPIELEPRHILAADFLFNRDRPQDSLWHQKLCRQLERAGQAHHKEIVMRSRADIDAYFREYVLGLVESLEQAGYDPVRGGKPGTALIGPDGDIHKAHAGNHRFFMARLLGVTRVPVAIAGVHEDWFAAHVGMRMDISRVRTALSEVAAKFA